MNVLALLYGFGAGFTLAAILFHPGRPKITGAEWLVLLVVVAVWPVAWSLWLPDFIRELRKQTP